MTGLPTVDDLRTVERRLRIFCACTRRPFTGGGLGRNCLEGLLNSSGISGVGNGRLLGSCGDLEGGSVISIMYLGTKVDVLHGSCKSGFGNGRLLGSCEDLEGGSVISIMYLGTKIDVLHGSYKSRQ